MRVVRKFSMMALVAVVPEGIRMTNPAASASGYGDPELELDHRPRTLWKKSVAQK